MQPGAVDWGFRSDTSLITRFRSVYPDIKIILHVGSSLDVRQSLLDLRKELVVVGMAEEVKGVTVVPFRREEVFLFSSPGHPLAQLDGIRFEQLEGQLILMKEEGSSTQALIRRLFDQLGMVPNVLVEASNLEFIKEMVEKGEGVSFLVRSAVEKDLEAGRVRLIPVRDRDMAIQVYIAYLADGDLSPAGQAFLRILEEEKAQFGRRGAVSEAQASSVGGDRSGMVLGRN